LVLVVGLLAFFTPGRADDQIPRTDEVPPPLPVPAAYLTLFNQMLDAGFARQSTSVADATRQFESLGKQRPFDPRLEYGLALVLLKNFRQSDAFSHIDAALQKDPAYLPAWQARVRELLRGKKYEEVNQRLVELSDVVGMFSPDPPPLALRQDAAEWMGRVTAFLEGPLGDMDVQKETEQTTARLRVGLGAELRPAFDAGRVALSAAHRRLQDEERQAIAAAGAAKQQKLDETQAKSEELGGERERLELTKDQWDAWVREQVGEIDSQLGALEKRYAAAESDLRAISDSMTLNRIETQRLLGILERQQDSQSGSGNRFPFNRGALQAQLAARQAELDQLLAQYDATDQERGSVLQTAQGLLANRQSSLDRYQQATGQAAKRIRQIRQWDQRLQDDAEKLARTPDRKAQSVTTIRRRMQTWSTFDDFTLDGEQARLLAEYEVEQQ
jgi:hypothetical protein